MNWESSMGTVFPQEKISFDRPAELPGLEIIRGENTTQCERFFLQSYMVNTNLDNGDPRTFGRARYRGKLNTATNRDTVLCEPGEILDVKYVSCPVNFRVLFIPTEALEKTARELGIQGPPPHLKLHVLGEPTFYQAFKKLHQSLETPCSILERQSRWTYCVGLLLKTAAEKAPPRSPKGLEKTSVRRAVEFLQEQYMADISLESLAKAARLSPFHFLREFARETGLPPHAYQIQLRLAKVRQLLRLGISPSQAAMEAGFFDQSHMIRHFKKSMGLTPAQYAAPR